MIRFLQSSGQLKKYILGGLLVIICGAMVITLVPGGILGDAFGFGTPEKGVIARVGSEDVTVNEVNMAARRFARMQFGGRSVPDQLMPYLRQRAADQLITFKALQFEAERMGFKVTDQEVQDFLQKGALSQYLFPNGNYVGDEAYSRLVENEGFPSIVQFEQAVKADLLRSKLLAAVEGPVNVSKKDIEQEFKAQNTKIKFDYAVLTLDDVTRQVKATDADLKTYYDNHKQNYVNAIPEKRTVKYVVIDTARVAGQVPVSPADLQAYYRDHQDQYRIPEQVNVRHILIKTPLPGPDGKTDDNAVKAAKQKADGLLAQLKSGGNFAELAKKNSDDPGSAEKGGDLGWINRGQTVPEFEKSAFSLKKGEISGLIQSTYGFHIIQLMDKHDAHLKTLDEVKADIEPVVRQEKSATAIDNLTNTVLTQAKAQGLEKAAQARGLEVITSNPITKTDTLPGIGTAPQMADAVFNAGLNGSPESVQTPQGFAIFQVIDVKSPQTPTFDEIRARVESEYKADRAQALLNQKANELSQNAKSSHDLKKAAKDVGAEYKTSELVTPSSQVPDMGRVSESASVAFTMNKGDISGPLQVARGRAVLMIVDRQEPAADEIAKGSEQTRQSLLSQKREQAFALFAAGLRQRLEKDGKIRMNKEEMARLTTTAGGNSGGQ